MKKLQVEGWKVEKLGDVIQLEYGKPLPSSKRSDEGKYPVYGANGEIARSNEYYYDKPTMIVGRKGSAGEINLTEDKFWALDVTYFVTFDETKYDLRFLYYLLNKLELTKLAKGVKPGINRNDVYSIEVSIPPLPEQQRIVSLLDETFAGLMQVHANAERNLVNAREVFEAELEDVFAEQEAKHKKYQLEELTEEDSPITYGVVKPGDYGDIRFVRGGDVSKGRVLVDQLRTITKEVSNQYKRTLLRGGELLMCLVGQPGQVAVAPDELAGANIARQVGLIRLRKDINAEYVRYFLQSNIGQKALGAYTGGSVQQVINLGDLRTVEVPLPLLEEQRAIVQRLDALAGETRRLEAVYQSKLKAVEELRKSVLQKAFEGEL